MLQLCCRLTIGDLFFELVNHVEINSTWKDFTGGCVIKLPRKVQNYDSNKLDRLIHRGDAVKVELGYDERFHTTFTGYVAFLKPTFPVELQCEDEMFKLKQTPVNPKSWTNATASDVLDYLGLKDYQTFGDIQLGAFRIQAQHDTAAKVLKKLKDEFQLYSFMRDGKLHLGDPYDKTYAKEVVFGFGYNIISHSLEYRRADEVKLRVKAISKNTDGKDTKIEVGDVEGENRTLHYFNKSLEQLKTLANRDLDRLKYTGYRGHFTTFGEPVVRHGDIVELYDPEEKEKDGKYWVDKVVTEFGMNGYRQEITLGPSAG